MGQLEGRLGVSQSCACNCKYHRSVSKKEKKRRLKHPILVTEIVVGPLHFTLSFLFTLHQFTFKWALCLIQCLPYHSYHRWRSLWFWPLMLCSYSLHQELQLRPLRSPLRRAQAALDSPLEGRETLQEPPGEQTQQKLCQRKQPQNRKKGSWLQKKILN